MPTQSVTAHLDATIKALQGSLTALAADKGVKNIDGWMTALEHAEFRGAKIIHENLGKLKRQLEADTLDGAAIAQLLRTLGEETARTASHAGAAGDKVSQLADLLGKSAGQLGK